MLCKPRRRVTGRDAGSAVRAGTLFCVETRDRFFQHCCVDLAGCISTVSALAAPAYPARWSRHGAGGMVEPSPSGCVPRPCRSWWHPGQGVIPTGREGPERWTSASSQRSRRPALRQIPVPSGVFSAGSEARTSGAVDGAVSCKITVATGSPERILLSFMGFAGHAVPE